MQPPDRRLYAAPPPLLWAAREDEYAVPVPGHFWDNLGYTSMAFNLGGNAGGSGDGGNAGEASKNNNTDPPWAQRVPKLVWRGATGFVMPKERDAVVALASRQPALVDAASCNSDGGSDRCDGFLTPDEQARFKYRVYVPGGMYAGSTRLKEQLRRGQLVFMESRPANLPPHAPFWVRYLKPWVHYVPLGNKVRN